MALNRGDFVFLGTRATAHNPFDHCTLKGTTGISWVEITHASKCPTTHNRSENALAPKARVLRQRGPGMTQYPQQAGQEFKVTIMTN